MLYFKVHSRKRSAEIANRYCAKGARTETIDHVDYQEVYVYS